MELNRPTLYDIACHFCVSRISGATIPATRLSNILGFLSVSDWLLMAEGNPFQQA
jgi:hypothetical protein